MPRKLKVYRTPIGFHDAYVAASSQKAALEAWGSDANLFARGIAEVVTDPELSKEPLANPGVVIKRTRGTIAEQIAALPDDKPEKSAAKAEVKSKDAARKALPKRPAQPRPDRSKVERAEQEIAEARQRYQKELSALADREAALARERERTERRQAAELTKLERTAEKSRESYRRAMTKWRG